MSEFDPKNTPDTPASEDKLEAASLTETSATVRKLDNFWYHYKWTVIVVIFFVSVAIVCLVQLLTRPKYDSSIAIGTYYRMNSEEYARFEALMEELLPTDVDGNGEKNVNILVYQYYSEEEIAAEEDRLEAESDRFAINLQYNKSEYDGFNSYTLTGETSVYIVSPALYKRLSEGDRLLSVADLYPDGNLPDGVRADGFGIDLGKTDLYKYNPAVAVLPESSILCFHRANVSGKNSDGAFYEQEKAFFRALADYTVEADE